MAMQKALLMNWDEVFKTTSDLINSIPDNEFHNKPFKPRFKSYAWEFSCILTTRLGYIRGIKTGNLNGSSFSENDLEFEKLNKKDIIKKLKETEDLIKIIIKKDIDKEIDYFDSPTKVSIVLSWLLQHEQFHYGKLLLYFAKSEINIPLSLKKMWGENSF